MLSIAVLNFKQASRDKFFLGIVFFFVLYLLFCILLGELSWGHKEKVLRMAGLAGIELTAVILVIFSFTFGYFRDKETRILEVYYSYLSRRAYISGKILAYLGITLCYLFFSGLTFSILLYFLRAFDWASLIALYPLFLKLSIIILFSSIFSCLFSSSTMALLSSLFMYIASEFAYSALAVVSVSAEGSVTQKTIIETLYALLPNMDKLDIKSLAAHAEVPSLDYFLWITVYAFLYIVFLWLINIFIIQKIKN